MKRPAFSLPDKKELFCSGCQKYKLREQIVRIKWIRNGKQAQFWCKACCTYLDALTDAAHGG